MRNARRSVLALAGGAAALIVVMCALAGAASAGDTATNLPIRLPGSPTLDGVPVSSLTSIEMAERQGVPLSRAQLGPITDHRSIERLIRGNDVRTRSTVQELRAVVAEVAGVDDGQPAGFGRNVIAGVPGGGVVLSSNRAELFGDDAKIDYDLWAAPMPTRSGGTWRSALTNGVRLTTTPGRNERHPAVDSTQLLLAFVGENSDPDAPEPPSADVREDHVYLCNPDGTDLRDVTLNFGRAASADVVAPDADGWEIRSLTFAPNLGVNGSILFASNYGLDPSVFKLWIAEDPGAGGTAVAQLWAPIAGMDTDAYVYDNPDCNASGDVLLDTNLNIGGQARRVYLISGAEMRPVTDGSKQVVPLGSQQLRDTQPHWAGPDNDVTFVSNRTTGGSDQAPDLNVWMLSDATAGVTAAEDDQTVVFRVGPVDEISTSADAPGATAAFTVDGTRYIAEEIESLPGDREVYLMAYTPSRVSAPAGVAGQPIVNGGNKDLSGGEDLVVQTDVRGFPAPGFGIEDSEVTQVFAVVWRAADYDPAQRHPGGAPGASFEHPTLNPPTTYPEYYVYLPADEPGEHPWDHDDNGANVSLAMHLANNFYDNTGASNPYAPQEGSRYRTNLATMAYLEAIIPLQYEGPSPDAVGYARWGNSTNPYDTSGLRRGDKLLGVWVMGSACRASSSAPAAVANFEFLYDNISGFTTQAWAPGGHTLVVEDYTDGQLFIQQIEYARGGEEDSYRTVGIPVGQHFGLQWGGMYYAPNDDALIRTSFTPADLVEGAAARFAPAGVSSPYDNAPADHWRIASRGPITADALNRYLPEQTPYTVSDANLGETPEEQYRGPFSVVLPTAPGSAPTRTPLDLYPGVRTGVIWGAPYAGDAFVGEGTITDPNTQATLRQYIDQGGGVLLAGQDIAWALSLDGAVQNSFLATYFGAAYAADDSGATGVTAQGTRGRYPAVTTANPVAHPPVPAGVDFWSSLEVDPEVLRFATPYSGPYCHDGSSVVNLTTGQTWPDGLVVTGANARVAYAYTDGSGAVAATYVQHTPLVEGTWGGRTAFLGFGLEGVSRGYRKTDNEGACESLLFRNKIVQCFLDWARTGRLDATVTAGSGIPGVPAGTPLAGVLVTARPTMGQSGLVYGMLTDSDGYCLFRGLPVGNYELKAYAPGLACDHQAQEFLWPEGTNSSGNEREGFSMTLAPHGTISGTVVDANANDGDGNPLPLEGIRVVATGWNADGTEAIDPLTRLPIVREATTGADGGYLIEDVPSQQTYWVVANPDPKSTPVQINHATDDTTYNADNLQSVVPSTDTPDVDFALEAMPGTVQGTVYVAGSSPQTPISGATVRVVGANPAIVTTTNAAGAYTLTGVPAGNPSIEGSAPGYAPSALTVEVTANGTSTLDIPLTLVPPGAVSGTVVASDGATGLQGVTIRAYFLGQTTPLATATTAADGTYTINPLAVGSYTVTATDEVGHRSLQPAAGRSVTVATAATTTGVDFQAVALTTWFSGLQMISTPYSYPSQTSAAVLSVGESDLRMAWWVPILNRYALYPETAVGHVVRGRGYFVRLAAAGASIDRLGEPSDDATFSQDFDLPLSELNGGWNMIGNPYTEDVDWYATKFVYGGQELTLAQAVAQKLVSASLFTYSNGGYEVRTVLEPYVGYWAKAEKAGVTVRFERPASAAAASTRGATAPVRNEGIEWSMQLTAEVGGVADRANFLGVAPEDEGLDSRFDVSEPPSLRSVTDRDVALYFTAGDREGGVHALASDYRASLGSASQWNFVVDTSLTEAPVRLSWPDLRALPRAFTATLEDIATGKTVSMRGCSSYDYQSDANGQPRQFRITVRATGAAGSTTPQILGVESLARGVSVSYRLQAEADVTVRILNSAGRVVRTVVSDQTRNPGIHSESWDGRDDAGRQLPAGEYRVELTAVAEDGSVGRATARAAR